MFIVKQLDLDPKVLCEPQYRPEDAEYFAKKRIDVLRQRGICNVRIQLIEQDGTVYDEWVS